MNDIRAFESAIRKNPDDQSLRLQYVDWLEDHGEEDTEYLQWIKRVNLSWGYKNQWHLPLSFKEEWIFVQEIQKMWRKHTTRWWSDFRPLVPQSILGSTRSV